MFSCFFGGEGGVMYTYLAIAYNDTWMKICSVCAEKRFGALPSILNCGTCNYELRFFART